MHTMRTTTLLPAALLGVSLLIGCDNGAPLATAPAAPNATTTAATGAADRNTVKTKGDARIVTATGDILASVNRFRDLLGAPNPNVAGEQPGGRREVNWDGVGTSNTNNDAFPGNFFNVNSPRGVLFSTPSGMFRISDKGYTDLNGNYGDEFNTFSPLRLFVARGSTITDVDFVVAGTNTPATVTGFGSVFADVGRAHSTRIEFYDVQGNRLLVVTAPRRSDAKGLSFAGAVFSSRIVARVRVISGDTPIGADDNVHGAGQKHDVVAMDDFIYGEPRAIAPN
jgi:hypothetical protein